MGKDYKTVRTNWMNIQMPEEVEALGQAMWDLNDERLRTWKSKRRRMLAEERCKQEKEGRKQAEKHIRDFLMEQRIGWIRGVRAWMNCDQWFSKELAVEMLGCLGLEPDVFDQIIDILTERPDLTDDKVADVLGWR